MQSQRIAKPSPTMTAILCCLGVMLFAGIVYKHVLTAGLINQDDQLYVLGAGAWPEPWWKVGAIFDLDRIRVPENTGGYYQPLVDLSLMLDARFIEPGHPRAFQYHLTNLCLHLANTALIFALILRLSRSCTWAALLALLFAMHPTQVESVAWIAQRMTLLGTLFTLIALWAYTRYGDGYQWAWLTLCTAAYWLAVLCRPMFIALPVVLICLDLWPLRRKSIVILIEKIPLFVVSVIAALLLLNVRTSLAVPTVEGNGGAWLIPQNIVAMLSRIAWPVDLTPYRPPASIFGDSAASLWLELGVLGSLVALLFWAFRASRPLFVALVGLGAFIMPAILEVPFSRHGLGDQYLYAALIVPFIVFGAWLGRQQKVMQTVWVRWSALGAAAIVCIFAVQAYGQSLHWQNGRHLYELTTRLYPEWVPAHIGLVEACIEDNNLNAGLTAAEKAVQMAPDKPSTQFYLGTVLLLHRDGRSREAIEPLRKALATDPDWIECLQNLGVALAWSGQSEEAIGYLEKARDLQPRSAGIRIGLGNAYLRVARYASARGEFAEALRYRNTASAHLGLAIAWAGNDMPEQAVQHLAAAIAKDPNFAFRAGRSPQLLRFRDHPGFDDLIKISDTPLPDDMPITAPAARRAHGS